MRNSPDRTGSGVITGFGSDQKKKNKKKKKNTPAAPSPSESRDITTAPLRLLKNKFHETVLCLISLIGYIFGALTHSFYTELSGSSPVVFHISPYDPGPEFFVEVC